MTSARDAGILVQASNVSGWCGQSACRHLHQNATCYMLMPNVSKSCHDSYAEAWRQAAHLVAVVGEDLVGVVHPHARRHGGSEQVPVEARRCCMATQAAGQSLQPRHASCASWVWLDDGQRLQGTACCRRVPGRCEAGGWMGSCERRWCKWCCQRIGAATATSRIQARPYSTALFPTPTPRP